MSVMWAVLGQLLWCERDQGVSGGVRVGDSGYFSISWGGTALLIAYPDSPFLVIPMEMEVKHPESTLVPYAYILF